MEVVQTALNYLKSIPSAKWCEDYSVDLQGRKDGFTHLEGWVFRAELDNLFKKRFGSTMEQVNDGYCPHFAQKTPKARIINALKKLS